MRIISPLPHHIPMLRSLWQEAFGDTDEFLDTFFEHAFSPARCRCITIDGQIVAALYWFTCEYVDKPVAYIYAVSTAKSHQRQGLCHELMEDTHAHLAVLGYTGAVLVPGSKDLFEFYGTLGYKTCSYIHTLHCQSADIDGNLNLDLHCINQTEYAKLRRKFLPHGSVIQENENLDFLETQVKFYAGTGFLLAAQVTSDMLWGVELLGDATFAPQIVQALGCKKGSFRLPCYNINHADCHNTDGCDTAFAMYRPLSSDTLPPPSYFGFAFD